RPLALGDAGALQAKLAVDDADAGAGGGDVGLRRLDPLGGGCFLGAGLGRLVALGGGLALELGAAGLGGPGLGGRCAETPLLLGQAGRLRRGKAARGEDRDQAGAENQRAEHRLSLRDDRGGWQGSRWRARAARRASRGPACAARWRGRS